MSGGYKQGVPTDWKLTSKASNIPKVLGSVADLEQALNTLGYTLSYNPRSGTATPIGAVTPLYIGEEYLETTTPKWYKATGLTDTDWVALN